jgi:hypothetical protein
MSMNYRDARAAFEPTSFPNVVPFSREPMSAERVYIERQIREHEAEIGRLAQKIRWLRLELETV